VDLAGVEGAGAAGATGSPGITLPLNRDHEKWVYLPRRLP